MSCGYDEVSAAVTAKQPPIVDVRTEDEFASGRIPGATNIPLSEVKQQSKLSSIYLNALSHSLGGVCLQFAWGEVSGQIWNKQTIQKHHLHNVLQSWWSGNQDERQTQRDGIQHGEGLHRVSDRVDQDGGRGGKIKAVITIMTCLEEAITVQRHLTKNIQTDRQILMTKYFAENSRLIRFVYVMIKGRSNVVMLTMSFFLISVNDCCFLF